MTANYLIAFTLADSAIVTFLSPFLANKNHDLLLLARLLMGVGEVCL